IAADPVQLDLAIATLRSFSLVTRHPHTQVITMHRLIQVVLRDEMDAGAARQWIERTVRAVNDAFPLVTVDAWPTCERYITHAQICRQLIEQESLQMPEAAELLDKAGYYLFERGRYQEAEVYLVQAVALREICSGLEHVEVATSLDHLAQLLVKRGRHPE